METTHTPLGRSLLRTHFSDLSLNASNRRRTLIFLLLITCLWVSSWNEQLSAQCSPCEPGNVQNDQDDPWSGDCYLNASCLPQGNPCQANDVTLTGIFIADSMGNPVGACSLGEMVTVLLWGNFANNTGTDRYAVRTNTQVWINDDCIIELNSCSFDVLSAGSSAQALVGTFSYICGQTIELRRTWIGWETQSAVCSDPGDPDFIGFCGEYSPSKCSRNFEILEFLAPNFSYDCGLSTPTTTEVCFDDFTMGGIPPLTYDWDFGDGGMSTLPNPCHTYNAITGTFMVELTVTDSAGTVAGAFLVLDLDSLACCTMEAICPPMDGGFFTCLEDVPPPDTNLIVIIDSCTNVITIVQHDTLGSGCGLDTMTLLRRYLFSDGNNLDTCIQLFKVVDDVPPVITQCAAAVSVQCAALIPPSDVALITATDNCAGSTITTFDGDVISNQICTNRYTVTRTYRVFDECLNSATCTQTISVFDNTPPQLTCPIAVLVPCASQIPAPNPASVTSTDNCGGMSTVTHVGDVMSNQTCANRLTITRTYRATDACGNSATCTQTISVFDNTAPTLTCPGSITVTCSNLVPTPNPASVTSTDNCGGLSTITFVNDVMSNMTCSNQFTLTRTYRATDACGNSATCAQTILVNDQTPPTITCPPAVTVSCASQLPTPNPGSVTSSDNCGGSASVTHLGDVVSNMICTNRFIVTRTYRATDACGNSASCSQVITVLDNTGPSITCPANVTVQCANLVPAPSTTSVIATDNCGGSVTITHAGDVNSMATCVNRFNIFRTYSAIDDCGNSSSCSQIISVFDNTPPLLTCPGTITVQCAGDIPTPNPASVTATDNCGGTATVSFLAAAVTNQICLNRFTLIRTYMATDDCGNTGTCNQSIVVMDNTAPSLTCPTVNLTVACANLVPPPAPESITATDNCGGTSTVTSVDVVVDSTCANQFVIIRTYTAADECGNSASCTQTITVFDNTSPSIFCPGNVTVACANLVPDAEPLNVIATDNCGGTASVTHQDDVITDQACANQYTLTRTYVAMDECGNSASCTQTITVNDTIAPILICPFDITLESGEDSSPQNTGMPSASDNCGAIPMLTPNDVTIAGDCLSDYTLQRTWTATDECGNSATCLQIIDVIGQCNVDLSLIKDIDAGQNPIDGGDNVNFTITVTNEGLLPVGSITVIDYIPLGFSLNDPDWTAGAEGSTGQSASIILSVGNGALSPGGLLPTESVSVQITLQAALDITVGIYENIAEITAVFDLAGNDVTASDVDSDPDTDDTNDPEEEDDHDPVLICVQAMPVITGNAFICGGETATYGVLNFNPLHTYEWSLPGGGGQIIDFNDSSIVVQWLASGGPFIVQFTETSAPGCVSVGTLIVSIQGAEAIACIDHINLSIDNECGTVVLSGLILLGEQAGNDNYEVVIMYMNGDTVPDATFTCEHIGQTFKVAVTSECSGQGCWGLVTVEDKMPPIIDCVCPLTDSCTIDCRQIQQMIEGNIPDSLRPTVIDNCCGTTTLVLTNIEADFATCGGGFVSVEWLATDASGNIATCIQQFDVIPLTLDSLTFPPDFEGECGESSDPSNTGWPQIDGIDLNFPAGVCNLYVTYRDVVIDMCGGGIKIIRTWTVIDWCTSTTSVFPQTILLIDHLGPVLTCVDDFTVGTDVWFCYANVIVPRPGAVDACSAIKSFTLSSPQGTVVPIGQNAVINGLPVGTHTVTWTVRDECNNSSTCSIDITVVDDVPPVVSCHSHTIVSLTSDRPNGITLIPAAVFNDGSLDNCGAVTFRARRMDSCIDFDWTTGGACVDDIPGGVPPVNGKDYGTDRGPCVPFGCCDVDSGPIMVELEVTDEAGNVNYCMVEVEVQDKISPSVECPPTIFISCEYFLDIEEGTFRDVEGNNDGTLDEDPLSAIFGNVLDASRHNQNEREDIIINDPDNTDFLQPHNWGIDGWATDNCEIELEVSVRVIEDCSGASFPGQAPSGAVKLIERRFRAYDGITAGTCVQRIWVIDYSPFFITDTTCNNANPNDGVIWPCDLLLTTCPDNLGGLAGPVIIEDGCSLIGTNFEDTRYDFADSACYKVLREWQIIDWCQFDPETGYGLWSYVQEIRVMDLIDPEFQNCPQAPLELCVTNPGITVPDNNQVFLGENDPNATSCSVHVTMSQEIHEDCSESIFYDVKVYPFNGTSFIQIKPTTEVNLDANHDVVISFDTEQSTIQSIQQNGLPYNSPLCGDYHRVVWTVEDGCGNINFCDYLFRLEDCKAPTPVCIDGISSVLMGPDGEVTIWASDFDASSVDDCTPSEELLFSFSGVTYQPSFTYTCENVPEFGEEIPVEIWVADGGADQNCNGVIEWSERNKTFCITHIIITDNEDICGQQQTMLSGEILTDHAEAVQKVIVTLSSPQHLFPAYTTSTDGKFAFASIPTGLDYTITPERNDDYKNGVSTLDLVKIQKHLLGRELLTSPYQYIAADANNSRSLSAVDLVELRKLILGLYTELPNNDSWRFMDKDFVMNDPINPWVFDENVFVQQWPGTNPHIDFIAIKIGDVNNTVKANALQILPRNGNRIMNLMAEMKEEAKQGEIIEMKLTFPEIVNGFQWTMESDGVEYVGVNSGDIQIDDSNVGVFEDGITTMSWNGEVLSDGKSKDNISIIIRWKVITPSFTGHRIRLTSLVTPAESYTPEDEILEVKLVYPDNEALPEFALYQNKPNPWNGQTTIGFDIPQDSRGRLTMFDATGKVLKVVEGDYKAGYNSITLTSIDLPYPGVIYYRLESGEYSANKKMVLIR